MIDMSDFFPSTSMEKWQSEALKSLKLGEINELENKLNRKSIEGIKISTYPEKIERPIWLSTFPKIRKFARFTDFGSNEDFLEGMNYHFSYLEKSQQVKKIDTQIHGEGDFLDLLKVFENLNWNMDELKSICKKIHHKNILIRVSIIHNAGGSILQELNFALSWLKFVSENLPTTKLFFDIALDSKFFNNIAKLRALRFMQESLKEQCSFKEAVIISTPSRREQTVFDPWMNMLRGTTVGTIGFLGGADIICVDSFDEVAMSGINQGSSPLGTRQSRNILNILKSESFLAQVEDPGAGSNVIENLTREYIAESFELFKQSEREGSLFHQMKKFSIQVETISKKRFENVSKGKDLIAGVNNYSNPEERTRKIYKNEILLKKEESIFPLRRLSFDFESLRLSLEKKEFNIQLFVYGEESQLSARIMYCVNFFEILGKKVKISFVDSSQKLNEENADIKILCALDSDYKVWLAGHELKGNFFVAGNEFKHPKCQNIYRGVNIYKTLSSIVEVLYE